MVYLNILFIALFTTVVTVPFFRSLAYKLNALDEPGERKVHARPIARTGGLAMAVGVLVPLLLWAPPEMVLRSLLLSSLIIVAAGFIDDLVGLGHRAKFSSQIAAALIIVLYGGVKIKSMGTLLPAGWVLSDWLAVPLTVIVIVGVTNAINLSDGLDGLAGGIVIISFILLGVLGYQVGNPVVLTIAAAVVGAIFGFLRYNTYPATIFMGDAGSQLLGFLVITLALKLTQDNVALSPLLPLLLIGFPILDTLTVMLARIYHGRSPFAADKNHFHHKLMRLGLYHSEAVFFIYLLQTVIVLAAYRLRYYSDWLILLSAFGLGTLVTIFFYLSGRLQWRWQRRDKKEYGSLQKRLVDLNKLTVMLKILFRLLKLNFALILLFIVLPVAVVPGWLAGLASAAAGLLLVGMRMQGRYYAFSLRFAIYLLLPPLLYLSAVNSTHSLVELWCESKIILNSLFIVLIVLSLLLLKLTRRSGYESTPLDFIILMIAVVVPMLIPIAPAGVNMGMMAVRIIAVFFAFEVIVEESRGRNLTFGSVVLVFALIVCLKWFTLGCHLPVL